jgi:hypothetical protein
MVENSDATSIVVTKIEPRRDGLAVLVRVKTQFGDIHLEIPVDQKDPTLALREDARLTVPAAVAVGLFQTGRGFGNNGKRLNPPRLWNRGECIARYSY